MAGYNIAFLQAEIPQPGFAPINPRWSLNTHRTGVEGSKSSFLFIPLVVKLKIAICLILIK